MKRVIGFLFLVIFFIGCFATKNTSNKNFFALIDATYENWTSGAKGGGRGTEYYFTIKITTNEKIEFDTAWTNKDAFKINISNNTGKVSNTPTVVLKNDTLVLRMSFFKSSNVIPTNLDVIKTIPPIECKEGEMLIKYYVKNRPYYFLVEKIKQIKSPNRP